jgi:hypothetical protein
MAEAEATVRELVGMIEHGELRLPEMQRRYVWRATRAGGRASGRFQCSGQAPARHVSPYRRVGSSAPVQTKGERP